VTEKKIIKELKHALALKRQFEKRFESEKKYGKLSEVLIRDVARMELYPKYDYFSSHEDVYPYFKIEIKGLYYGGVELWSGSSDSIIFDEKEKKWRFAEPDEKNKVDGIRTFRISFDNIIKIDWGGDEYYRMPHIFCHFKYDGWPYKTGLYYVRHDIGNVLSYFPVEDISPLEKI